jgi:tetratricopeptide (TPR) repeat protein
MKNTLLKYRWLIIIVGLIIIGGGIFFWLANRVDQPLPPAAPTEPAPPQPTVEMTISPVSPASPISPIVSNEQSPPKAAPHILQTMIDQALQAQQQKDYSRAIDLVDKILAEDPANFIAFNLRGSAFMELGETDKALADYTRAVELEPLFAHSLYNRGRLLRLQGRYEESMADLQRAADLSPAEFGYRANGNIGLIYYAQQEYEQALAAFEKSITANVGNKADVYFFRGETYLATGNWEAAIQDYQAPQSASPITLKPIEVWGMPI